MSHAPMTDPAPTDQVDQPAPADGVPQDDGPAGSSMNALSVLAVFVGVQLPSLAALFLTGVFSPVSHGLAALVAGVLVLILDRITRASVAEQAAEHIDAHVEAAVQRAVFDARAEAEAAAGRLASASATIARRSRDLLDHEFTLIDRLEADEEDGERLRDLFELDHLATRMNRNVASMLVLAGGWPTRAVEGRPPMSEVLRAGMGEVEDYSRIDLRIDGDVDVEAGVVGPIIHLTSELLEWVLGQTQGRVELRGQADQAGSHRTSVLVPDGEGGELLDQLQAAMAVTDGGVPDQVEQLGLHLVSQLAVGLGARVHGARGGAGVELMVDIPADVLQQGVSHSQRRQRSSTPAPPVPARTQPVPTQSIPSHPVPSQPTPVQAVPSQPVPSQAVPVQPAAARPAAMQPTDMTSPSPVAPAAPASASAWSYAGYVDGSEDASTSGSRWGLRGMRRRRGSDDGPEMARAQQAAALVAEQQATPAPATQTAAPASPSGDQAAAGASPQRPVDHAPGISETSAAEVDALAEQASHVAAQPAPPAEDDTFAALAGLIDDAEAPPLPVRGRGEDRS